ATLPMSGKPRTLRPRARNRGAGRCRSRRTPTRAEVSSEPRQIARRSLLVAAVLVAEDFDEHSLLYPHADVLRGDDHERAQHERHLRDRDSRPQEEAVEAGVDGVADEREGAAGAQLVGA